MISWDLPSKEEKIFLFSARRGQKIGELHTHTHTYWTYFGWGVGGVWIHVYVRICRQKQKESAFHPLTLRGMQQASPESWVCICELIASWIIFSHANLLNMRVEFYGPRQVSVLMYEYTHVLRGGENRLLTHPEFISSPAAQMPKLINGLELRRHLREWTFLRPDLLFLILKD